MEFNLQQFLSEMRQEQNDRHDKAETARVSLATKIDDGFKDIGEKFTTHETKDAEAFHAMDKRLVAVEGARKLLLWVGTVTGVGVIGAGIDFIKNHMKWVK